MGYELYNAYESEQNQQRMKDLLNGRQYYDEYSNLMNWKGIVHDTNFSLIAGYVYYFLQQNSATQTLANSTASVKSEAAISVSPADKMVIGWRQFVKEGTEMIKFIYCMNNYLTQNSINSKTYPEFTDYNLCKSLKILSPVNVFGI